MARQETHPANEVRILLEVVNAGSGVTGLTPKLSMSRVTDGHYLQAGGASWAAGFAEVDMVPVDASNWPGLYEYVVPDARINRTDYEEGGYRFRCREANNSILEHGHITIMEAYESPWDHQRASHTTAGTFGEGVVVEEHNAGAIESADFAAGAINAAAIDTDAITAAKIAANAIGASELATDAIGSDQLATSAVNEIVDQTWTEALADHSGSSGSMAEALDTASTSVSTSAIADAVWDEVLSGHVSAGSAGEVFQRIHALRQGNMRVEYTSWDSEGRPTAGTVHVYPSKAALTGDTAPYSGTLGTYAFTATYDSNGRPTLYASTQET